MKKSFKISLIATAALAITIFSCKKIDDLSSFSIDYNTEFTIPASTVIIPFEVSTPEIDADSGGEFSDENTNKSRVESVHIKEMTVTIKSPSGSDFSFLNKVEVFVKADGYDEKRIAWKDPVPQDIGATLTLDVTDESITEFVKADSFSYRVNFTTDETIPEDHVINLYSDFRVKAKVF